MFVNVLGSEVDIFGCLFGEDCEVCVDIYGFVFVVWYVNYISGWDFVF